MAIKVTEERIGGVGGDVLLTAEEVAGLLRVTKGWVYAAARAGQIPHVRLGRYIRYRADAIARWITELERDSTSTTRR
jgi:excisionase family DNA binding protein